jgi:Cysteine-rich CWC
MVAGDATCWCADLPLLAELPVRLSDTAGSAEKLALSCFCPACLKSLTNPTP